MSSEKKTKKQIKKDDEKDKLIRFKNKYLSYLKKSSNKQSLSMNKIREEITYFYNDWDHDEIKNIVKLTSLNKVYKIFSHIKNDPTNDLLLSEILTEPDKFIRFDRILISFNRYCKLVKENKLTSTTTHETYVTTWLIDQFCKNDEYYIENKDFMERVKEKIFGDPNSLIKIDKIQYWPFNILFHKKIITTEKADGKKVGMYDEKWRLKMKATVQTLINIMKEQIKFISSSILFGQEEFDKTSLITFNHIFNREQLMTENTIELFKNKRIKYYNEDRVEELFKKYENKHMKGKIFNNKQREAIINMVSNSVAITRGGPGCGKTTCVDCALYIKRTIDLDYSENFYVLAPTGAAFIWMASTLHENKPIPKKMEEIRIGIKKELNDIKLRY